MNFYFHRKSVEQLPQPFEKINFKEDSTKPKASGKNERSKKLISRVYLRCLSLARYRNTHSTPSTKCRITKDTQFALSSRVRNVRTRSQRSHSRARARGSEQRRFSARYSPGVDLRRNSRLLHDRNCISSCNVTRYFVIGLC